MNISILPVKGDIYACGHQYAPEKTDVKGGEYFVSGQFTASFASLLTSVFPLVKLTSTLVDIRFPGGKLMPRAREILFQNSSLIALPPYEHQYSRGKTDIYACGHQISWWKTDAKGGNIFISNQFGASFAPL